MSNEESEIYDLKLNKTKVKKMSHFDQQLNVEYAIYQKDHSSELLSKKVDNELYLSKLKKKLNFIIYPSFIYCLYCILLSDISSITVLAFLAFAAAKSYYAINVLKRIKYTEPKSYGEIKLISDEQFTESYASKDLLNAYKETVGEEKYQEVLFKNGSDIEKIKIKELKV